MIARVDDHDVGAWTIHSAAYDPAGDDWRPLPSIDIGEPAHDIAVAWTGTELLIAPFLSNGGTRIYSLSVGDDAFIQVQSPPGEGLANRTLAWSGEELIVEYQDGSERFLATWSPDTGSWKSVRPPRYLGGSRIVWTGDRLVFPSAGLAFDPTSETWATFDPPPGVELSGEVTLWAADRLVVWGGSAGDGAPLSRTGTLLEFDQ